MPVFKYFDENGKLITERRETLNASNIERFIARHGKEKVAVYLEALYDVYQDMDDVTTKPLYGGTVSKSPHRTRRSLLDYLREKHTLFQCEQVKPLMSTFTDPESLNCH